MKVILSHQMLEALFAKADARPGQMFSLLYAVEPEMYMHLVSGRVAEIYASGRTVGEKSTRRFRNDKKRPARWTLGRWSDKDTLVSGISKHLLKISAGVLDE